MKAEGPLPHATRSLLPDAVARQIQSKILDGTLRAGERLPPERELAQQLGVNRSSVREALKKLEQLRLVAIQQGSGIRVQSPDEASFDLVGAMLFPSGRPNLTRIADLLELREILFGGSMRLALERASGGEIEEVVGQLHRAADPDLPDEDFVQALSGLQHALACISGNRILVMLSNSLGRFTSQAGFRSANTLVALDRRLLVSLARRLAVAMEARDVERAQGFLMDILRRVTRATLKGLDPPIATA